MVLPRDVITANFRTFNIFHKRHSLMPLSRSIFWAMNTFDQIIEQQKYHLCCPPTYFFSHSAINRPSIHANNRATVKYFTSFQCFLAIVAFFYRASADPMMAEGVRSTLTITPAAAAAPSVEVNNNDDDWTDGCCLNGWVVMAYGTQMMDGGLTADVKPK